MSAIDLHIHSSYSADGQFRPDELVALASAAGLRVLSLTDHNSCRGCPEMAALAAGAGLDFINGIELDCRFEDVWLHVLGYGVDPLFGKFFEVETDIIEQEKKQAEAKMDLFESLGFRVDRERIRALSPNGIIWGEMIGAVLLADPANLDRPDLAPYRPGGPCADNPLVHFDWDFCSPGRVAHFRIEFLDLAEAATLIRAAGGVPVLAHPGRDIKENPALLKAVAEEGGLWGLEVYSSYHSPAQTDFYLENAVRLGLIPTCGSDFHGKTKPNISLGSVSGPAEVSPIRLPAKGQKVEKFLAQLLGGGPSNRPVHA